MATGTILVVDDERNVLNSWSRALRLAGYKVHAAQTAKDALRLSDEHHIDLVVLDFLMPNMTGVELLRRIRKKLPFVRSIIVSGKIDETSTETELSRTLRQAIEADVYLHKPVANDRLKENVRILLEERTPLGNWEATAGRAIEAHRATIGSAKEAAIALKKLVRKRKK